MDIFFPLAVVLVVFFLIWKFLIYKPNLDTQRRVNEAILASYYEKPPYE